LREDDEAGWMHCEAEEGVNMVEGQRRGDLKKIHIGVG
jgi:hypothetical protein